jgi:site-specific DNA-methyltransferase (adenine-specific)
MAEWTLYEGDCLEVMRGMQNNSVDVIVTDPPYGVNYDTGETFMPGEFANVLPLALPELYRILRPDGAIFVFSSSRNLADWALRFQIYFKLQNILVWDKEKDSGCWSPSSFAFQYEPILFGLKGKRKLTARFSDVIRCKPPRGRERVHPTQKPVDLCRILIRSVARPGMLVYDPFAGSGTTLVAAYKEGVDSIGSELNPEYCNIIRQRMAALQQPLPLAE